MYIHDNINMNSYYNKKFFGENLREKQNIFSNLEFIFLFQKSYSLWDSVEKYDIEI